MLEVSMDVMSGDGMALLRDARLGGCDLLAVAETEMSKLLDEARRRHWAECGEPPRPEYPPRYLLVEEEGGFATEPLESTSGGLPESRDGQWQKFEEQHARDAEAQILWEARARRDFEARQAKARRREAPPDTSESRARPDGLRPSGDRTDVTSGKGRDAPHLADRSGGAIDLATVRDAPSPAKRKAKKPKPRTAEGAP